MAQAIQATIDFVKALNEKFISENRYGYADGTVRLIAIGYRKYDKIVETGRQTSAFAFVDRDSGGLYKAASFKAPAKQVRYNGNELMTMALEDADPYGSFLYMNK